MYHPRHTGCRQTELHSLQRKNRSRLNNCCRKSCCFLSGFHHFPHRSLHYYRFHSRHCCYWLHFLRHHCRFHHFRRNFHLRCRRILLLLHLYLQYHLLHYLRSLHIHHLHFHLHHTQPQLQLPPALLPQPLLLQLLPALLQSLRLLSPPESVQSLPAAVQSGLHTGFNMYPFFCICLTNLKNSACGISEINAVSIAKAWLFLI